MEEKIEFQYIMNYKAYRRGMLLMRLSVTLAAIVGTVFLYRFAWALGLIVPLAIAAIGAVWILSALHNEETYTVYNTRCVIKSGAKRRSVALEKMRDVRYKRAFYEKDLATGTVIIVAQNDKGKLKKYRMRHIVDAMPCVEYLKSAIRARDEK